MKNQFYQTKFALALFTTILIVAGGCQESLIDQVPLELGQGNQLSLKDGILKFESFDDYNGFFENSESFEIPKFSNAFEVYFDSKRGNQENLRLSESANKILEDLEDSSLLKLLDKDFMIIIGDYYFSLDFENETVGVSKNELLASNLRNHDFNHPEILVFSFEDEVLELLEEGSSSTVNGRSMLFCNDRTASSNKDKVKYYEYVDTEAGFKYQVQAKHGYQTAGIYFSLMTQVKHMSKPLEAGNLSPWSTSNTYLHLERYTKFKRRCSSTHEGNSPITKLWDNKINFRPHEGTKKLARYIIKSTYTIEERNVLGNGLLVDIVLEDLNDGY